MKICLMSLCFAASGGWQEPENPHTQRVGKASSEKGQTKKRWRKTLTIFHFISGYGICLEICDVYFDVCYTQKVLLIRH